MQVTQSRSLAPLGRIDLSIDYGGLVDSRYLESFTWPTALLSRGGGCKLQEGYEADEGDPCAHCRKLRCL